MIRGALDQIKFDNINKEFMAIVYEDTGAEKLYDTVSLSNARSVAYVSAAALNAGETGDILLTNVKNAGYDLLGVNFADETYTLGQTTYESYEEMAAALDYTDAFEFAKKGKVFKVGDASALATENMQKIAMKWVSSNTDVATVDEDGDMLAKAAGKTTITAYVGASLETAIFKTSCEVDVYSEADYNKIIAPLNAEGSDIETWIYYSGAIGGEIAFDEDMGAYKYTYKEGASTSWYDHAVGFKTDSEEFKRYAAGRYEYPYLAVDFRFEGTGKTAGVDFYYNSLLVFTSGTDTGTVADGNFFRLDYGKVKYYKQNAVATSYSIAMLSEQWYTLYVPLIDGYNLTTTAWARLFSSAPFERTDGSLANYWIRNLRFSALPVALEDGATYKVTEDNVGQFAGYGWELTKAPAGVHVIAGNQISLTVAGEYTATNGTDTVSFTILSDEDYADFARIIAPMTTAKSASALTTLKTTGSVSFDETKGAAKFTFTAPNTSWYENTIGFYTSSEEFKRMKAGRELGEYTWMAFEIQFEGTGGRGTDFNNFLIFPTGDTNKTNSGQFYQGHYGEIRRYNTNNVAVSIDQMKSGEWYTIYFPLTETNQITVSGAFFTLLSMNPITTTNADGSKTAKNANYWIRNLRFESDLPTA
ncbi:MAG: Ig-like domain-containing protein [Clostridia bacterium]|nr:Ig-like domain-containing protein [Clostridia bacterium]